MFRRGKRLSPSTVLILCCIVVLSAATSFSKLDSSLDVDEFFAPLEARLWLRDGVRSSAPHWHGDQGDGWTVSPAFTTCMVAGAFWALGESEAAARLPSGVFACLGVVLTFFVGRALFRTSVGLWAAGLAATMPIFIQQARTCRMYAEARFFALLTCFLLFCLIEDIWRCSADHEAAGTGAAWRGLLRWLRSWRAIGLVSGFVLSAALMVHLHVIGLVLFPAALLYCGYLIVLHARRFGAGAALRTPLAVICGVSVLAVLSGVVASGRLYPYFVKPFVFAGAWVTGTNLSPLAYHWTLQRQGLTLYALFPLGLLLACSRGRRQGVYCSVVFVTAFGLMSLFKWKGARFLSVHMGMYVLLCALAADGIARALARQVRASSAWQGRRLLRALTVVALSWTAIAATVPQVVVRSMSPAHAEREAFQYVKAHRLEGDGVAVRWYAAALYYMGSFDYVIAPCATGRRIVTKRDLARAVKEYGRLWIVIEKRKLQRESGVKPIPSEIREVLLRLEPVYMSPPKAVLVYLIDGNTVL